jgi:peroxiredoxin
LVVTALVLVARTAVAQQEPVELSYKLRKGDVFQYQVRLESNNSEIGHEVIEGQEILVVTASEEEGGSFTITPFTTGLRVVESEIDEQYLSALAEVEAWREGRPDDFLTGENLNLVDGRLNPFLGLVRARVPRDGREVESEVEDESSYLGLLPMSGGSYLARHGSLLFSLGTHALFYGFIVLQPLIQLPDRPVRTGDSWVDQSREWATVFGPPDKIPPEGIKITYRLGGFETVNGYRCAKIEAEWQLEKWFPGSRAAGNGALYLAVDEGLPIKEEVRMTISSPDANGEQVLTSSLVRHDTLSKEELEDLIEEIAKPLREPSSEPSESTNLEGALAPNLELPNLLNETVSVSDWSDQVVQLNFWLTWLPASTQMLPVLQELHDRYQERGFTVVAVVLQSAAERPLKLVEPIVDLTGVTYPVLMGGSETYPQFAGKGSGVIPYTVLIDREGIIRKEYNGYKSTNQMADDIEELLSNEP